MDYNNYSVLCVDDEQGILHSLQRLLRKDGYRIMTASSGVEGLKILQENEIHLVISDQRMPEMSGTEFLAEVRKMHPDVIRIILTGYTDVDSITEAINKGYVYKLFFKPWNDQALKLEIRQALDQYELVQANKQLHEQVLVKNEELIYINKNLEELVEERTKDMRVQNQALELSQAVLEDVPLPITGVSFEGLIVMLNRNARLMPVSGKTLEVGKKLLDYFPWEVEEKIMRVFEANTAEVIQYPQISGPPLEINCIPLTGRFKGTGVILTLQPLRQ